MSHLDLYLLCVAAYSELGVPEESRPTPVGDWVFTSADVGSVFWVGLNDVYVRGCKRSVGGFPEWGMPPGTIGVLTGVFGGATRSVVSVVHLNSCLGKAAIVPNPIADPRGRA